MCTYKKYECMDPKMCLNIIWMGMKIEVHWPLIVERGEIFIIFSPTEQNKLIMKIYAYIVSRLLIAY